MTLGNKIIKERNKNGWSQEELADKLGVSGQTVSEWESSRSVPDLQSVILMAGLFGVSTDYLLREDPLPEDTSAAYTDESTEKAETVRRVSMEEANEFLDMKRKGASAIANAVSMCITSPVPVVVLGVLAKSGIINIKETLAGGVGAVFLFCMVAAAVVMFITHGIREGRMEYLEKESFETEYGVIGMVKEKSRSYEPVFARGMAIGVALCILAVIPIIIAGALEVSEDITPLFAALLLILIAVGVNMMIRVGIVNDSYNALLQKGDFSKSEKRSKGKRSLVSGVYWALITAIYLGWSFWTMRWDATWIIWPVAGVLFVAVSGVSKLIVERQR